MIIFLEKVAVIKCHLGTEQTLVYSIYKGILLNNQNEEITHITVCMNLNKKRMKY